MGGNAGKMWFQKAQMRETKLKLVNLRRGGVLGEGQCHNASFPSLRAALHKEDKGDRGGAGKEVNSIAMCFKGTTGRKGI